MHVIIGILTLVVTILVLITRLSNAGVDIGWLDPFRWNRRRKWQQKCNVDPLFCIDDPMEATACLMYTMVRCSGDISREEKASLLSMFQNDFQLSEKEAVTLLSTCSFYIKDEKSVTGNLQKFIRPSLHNFTSEQKDSALSLIERASQCDGNPQQTQIEFLEQIKTHFTPKKKGNW